MDSITKQSLTKITNSIKENDFVFITKEYTIINDKVYSRVASQWKETTDVSIQVLTQKLPSFKKVMEENESMC